MAHLQSSMRQIQKNARMDKINKYWHELQRCFSSSKNRSLK